MKNLPKIVESVLPRRWCSLATVWRKAAEHPDMPNEPLDIVDVWVALDKLVDAKKAKMRPARRADCNIWKRV